MMTLADIKRSLIEDSNAKHTYGAFLDRLAASDLREKDATGDLWYFSFNTDFCLDSAEHFLSEISTQILEYTKTKDSSADSKFNFDTTRRFFGCLCFYLYSALESFAHETNLFYELNLDRRKVSITTISTALKKLRADCSLLAHLETALADPLVVRFLDYRNAIVHGYIFPLAGYPTGLFIKTAPRSEIFTFQDTDVELESFCNESFSRIKNLITISWIRFSRDELLTTTS